MSSKTFDKEFIKELAELLTQSDLTEIELEQNGARLRVKRDIQQTIYTAPSAVQMPAQNYAPQTSEAPQNPTHKASPLDEVSGEAVLSPMVGIAYLAPDPESPPFVKIGDHVNQGDVLLIVEAMKVMNNIPAPKSGIVKDILVDDKQPVEFDQKLIIIE